MTPRTGHRDPASPGVAAVFLRDAKFRRHSVADVLADPRVRLGLGSAATLATALSVHSDRVGWGEARAFHTVNGLPDSLYGPAWMIMQLGTVGAPPAAAGAAWVARDHKLAWRLLAAGSATWALSKLVKWKVRRPRPAMLLADARCRGREASGLGYLSGHAGVAVALGVAAAPRFGATGRAVTAVIVPIVGLSRIYVGAHLPLDVVGGAALGLAVDAAVALIQASGDREPGPLTIRDGDATEGRHCLWARSPQRKDDISRADRPASSGGDGQECRG